MGDLLALLKKVKLTHKVVMIYIHEAQSDDVWPIGYGINSAKNLEEKWTNYDALMKKWPQLNKLVDQVFVDNMANDFIHLSGCWPEAYFFADKDGVAQWSGTNTPFLNSSEPQNHDGAQQFLDKIGVKNSTS